MTEYQKARINTTIRNEWEAANRLSEKLHETNYNDEAKKRIATAIAEHYAYANGMREALEMCGYEIGYMDGTPQLV